MNKEKEIEKPQPTVYYSKTKVNDHDSEEIIKVVGDNLKEAKETFKEIKEYINKCDKNE